MKGGAAYGNFGNNFSHDGIRLRRKTLSVLIPDNHRKSYQPSKLS